MNNVSAAVRAFWISGQKAQFDGLNGRTGEKRFRAVSSLQEETSRKVSSIPRMTPGSFVDFHVSPTITALSPSSDKTTTTVCGALEEQDTHLNAAELMSVLSVDFARALKDLAVTYNDIKLLSSLGNLPITQPEHSTLRIHFPGCDGDCVERLCAELGVQRGIVRQDADFDDYAGTEMALLFPFAPATSSPSEYSANGGQMLDWRDILSPTESDTRSLESEHSFEEIATLTGTGTPHAYSSSPSGYESLHASDNYDEYDSDDGYSADGGNTSGGGAAYFEHARVKSVTGPSAAASAAEYEGVEGIYRFLEQCEGARR